MAQGTIIIKEGSLLSDAIVFLEYDHVYSWIDDSETIETLSWEIVPGSTLGGRVTDGDSYYGIYDTPSSGPRNPGATFSTPNVGDYTIKCTVLIFPLSGGQVTLSQVLQVTVTENNNIIQRQTLIEDVSVACNEVAIKVDGVDKDGLPLAFNKYQINDGAVVDITSTTTYTIPKSRSDNNFKIKIFATDLAKNTDTKVNTTSVPLTPTTIGYTISFLDVVVDTGYRYDYGEGGGYTTDNTFHFATAGAKTVLVKDSWGCIRSISLTAVSPLVLDLDDFKSTFYSSKASSIRLVEVTTFDDCSVYKTDENTFGCEVPYKDITYSDKQRVKRCNNVIQQFKSGYDTHLVEIRKSDGTLFSTPAITKVQKNIKYEDTRAFVYKEDATYTYIYFDQCRNIPYFYEEGGIVTIGLESQSILGIVYLEANDIWAIKTLKFSSYTDTNVSYIYNRQIYDVYEFNLHDTLLEDGEYYVELSGERTTATSPEENKTINYKSLPIIVAESFEGTCDIRFWNNRNNDIYWQSGIINFLVVGLDYRVSIGETENTVVGTDDTSFLEKSYGREKFKFLFEPMTLEIARKLVAALSQFHVTINNTRYAFDNVSHNAIGEYTNDYTVEAEGYKADEDDYYVDQLGDFVGGFIGAGSGITLVHRECDILRNLTDNNISIIFEKPFGSIPSGVGNLKAYKMVQQGSFWVAQDVLINFPSENWLRQDGFDVTIDALEPIGGVIVEYCFY